MNGLEGRRGFGSERDCWSSHGGPSGERAWAETWITKWTVGKQCSRRGNSKSGKLWERKPWWVQATQGEDSWNRVPALDGQFPQTHSAAVRRDGVATLFLTFCVSPGRAKGHIPRKCLTLWSCTHTNRCFNFLILTIIVNKNKVNGGHQNCAECLRTLKDCVLFYSNSSVTQRSSFLGSCRDFYQTMLWKGKLKNTCLVLTQISWQRLREQFSFPLLLFPDVERSCGWKGL